MATDVPLAEFKYKLLKKDGLLYLVINQVSYLPL